MATFNKGQSFKGQRVHVASAFEQKGGKGMNVSFSMSNDTREGEDVFTDPMLSYDHYIDADGKKQNKFAVGYSKSQWEKIEAAANKDGDKMVLIADLIPNSRGKGLIINTNGALKTPEVPFDNAKHQENTAAARDAKKEARTEANAGKETEQPLEA